MSKEIVLYPGRSDIAYVSRELATARDREVRKSTDVFRVSDMYIGRYGVLSYVELSMVTGSPHLGGVLEIPGSLVESMRKVPGMMGYFSEVFFGQDRDFTTVYGRESLQHPSLEGATLFDSTYFWFPHPDTRRVDPVEVATEIKRLEEEIMGQLTNFDSILDRFVPEDRRSTYSSLPMLGPGHLSLPGASI